MNCLNENWYVDEFGLVASQDEAGDKCLVARVYRNDPTAYPERARLIAAAPEMARLLVRIWKGAYGVEADVLAVLKKIGKEP